MGGKLKNSKEWLMSNNVIHLKYKYKMSAGMFRSYSFTSKPKGQGMELDSMETSI